MNKKLLRVALLVAVVAVAGLGVHKAQAKKTTLSDIMLANVEALSRGESSTTWECKGIFGWCSVHCDKCNASLSAPGSSLIGTHSCTY